MHFVCLFFVQCGSRQEVGLVVLMHNPPEKLCGSAQPLRHLCSVPVACEWSRQSCRPPAHWVYLPHPDKTCAMTTKIKQLQKQGSWVFSFLLLLLFFNL